MRVWKWISGATYVVGARPLTEKKKASMPNGISPAIPDNICDLWINGVGPCKEEGGGRYNVRDRAMMKDALMDYEQVDEMVDQSLG